MPDICDRAEEEMQFLDSLRMQTRTAPQQPSSTHCQSCSLPIPEKRQKALPGVELCADCQSLSEKAVNQRKRMFTTTTLR